MSNVISAISRGVIRGSKLSGPRCVLDFSTLPITDTTGRHTITNFGVTVASSEAIFSNPASPPSSNHLETKISPDFSLVNTDFEISFRLTVTSRLLRTQQDILVFKQSSSTLFRFHTNSTGSFGYDVIIGGVNTLNDNSLSTFNDGVSYLIKITCTNGIMKITMDGYNVFSFINVQSIGPSSLVLGASGDGGTTTPFDGKIRDFTFVKKHKVASLNFDVFPFLDATGKNDVSTIGTVNQVSGKASFSNPTNVGTPNHLKVSPKNTYNLQRYFSLQSDFDFSFDFSFTSFKASGQYLAGIQDPNDTIFANGYLAIYSYNPGSGYILRIEASGVLGTNGATVLSTGTNYSARLEKRGLTYSIYLNEVLQSSCTITSGQMPDLKTRVLYLGALSVLSGIDGTLDNVVFEDR